MLEVVQSLLYKIKMASIELTSMPAILVLRVTNRFMLVPEHH